MKLRILTVAALLAATAAQAQITEIGLNGGIGTTTLPRKTAYQGNEMTFNPNYGLRVHYNINEYWQVGVDANMTKWYTNGLATVNGPDGQLFDNQPVTYLLGEQVTSIVAQGNHMHPHYDITELNDGNFYYGVSAGVIFTTNDGELTKTELQKDPAYSYVSEYHYQPGRGWTAGVQVGYSFWFGNTVGVNIEFAPRYCAVYSIDPRYGRKNEDYTLITLPVSAGLRFRF